MREREVIKQLRLIRYVQPEKNILQVIRKEIKSPYQERNRLLFKKSLPVIPILSTFLFASIVIISTTIFLFPDFVGNIVTNVRVTFAANQYDKAKIALARIDEQLSLLERNSNDENKIFSFSHNLAIANTQMSELRLVGEKGKYTSYQCLELYESYHEDLEKIQSTLLTNRNSSEELLITQAEQYNNAAAAKLEKYHRRQDMDTENKQQL